MGEPRQRLGFGKPRLGAKLLDKARQGRGTHPAHRGWWRGSGCGKNHPFLRHILLHVWRSEMGRCKYWPPRPRTRRWWLQVRCNSGYRMSNPVVQLQSFQKGRRRKGVLIPTVGSIPRWWPSAFNDVNTRQASTWRRRMDGHTPTHKEDSHEHESARILGYI